MNRFKDLLFTPIACPPVPNKKNIIDTFVSRQNDQFIWWKEDILLGERNPEFPFGTRDSSWNSNALRFYPELSQFISANLPFEKLFYVALFQAQQDVPAHVDANYTVAPHKHHMTATQELIDHQNELEPVGYRIIINGSRDSLFFCGDYDPQYKTTIAQEKHYTYIPEQTDVFLLRNNTMPHGVDLKMPEDEIRLVVFCLGFLDKKSHEELLTESIEKFGNFAIVEGQLRV